MTRTALMVGPDLSVKGGMTSVERAILARPPAGWRIEHVASFVDGSAQQRVSAFVRGYRTARVGLRRAAVQHVHMSQRADVLRAIAFLRAAEARGVPTLLHAHASEFAIWFDRLPKTVRGPLASGLRRAPLLAVLSASWKRYYQDALGLPDERVVVLPNPVAVPERPAPGSRDGYVRVAFLGRIGHRKGAFDLLAAVAALPIATRNRLRLVIAGDGDIAGARREASRPELRDVVDVRSWLDPDERDALLRGSDAFALPSRNEGLPMSLLEAMAYGLAPIATPVGGIPELVEDGSNGLLVPPGDRAALTRALARLIDDAPTRRALSARARERVLPFSTDRYAVHLGELYARLESRTDAG